jgi:hypothetical protein
VEHIPSRDLIGQGPIDGEVPTSYPSILQQCGFWYDGLRKAVDIFLGIIIQTYTVGAFILPKYDLTLGR